MITVKIRLKPHPPPFNHSAKYNMIETNPTRVGVESVGLETENTKSIDGVRMEIIFKVNSNMIFRS